MLFFNFCSTTKVNVLIKDRELNLSNCYYQELIPGQVNQKVAHNLYFSMKDSLNRFEIDSLLFENKIKNFTKQKRIYKCDLGSKLTKTSNLILVYYHSPTEMFKAEITNVLIKEPLYLP